MASSGKFRVSLQQQDPNNNQANRLTLPPCYFNPSSRCQNGAHECPYCMFEGLETPEAVVPHIVKQLFSTNDPPDENSLPSLLASLDVVISISTSVDRCIDAVQAILEQMRSAKETCALSIQQHRMAMHPIRSIPDDILRTIFDWHLIFEEGMKPQSPKDAFSSEFSPWTLSHVSRSWRALALSSPRLWSTFDIVPHTIRSKRSLAFKAELVQQRAAGCDLTIRLVDNPIIRNGSMAHYIALMLPTTRQWRSLQLLASDPQLIAPLKTCSFDSLVDLMCTFCAHDEQESCSLFKNARNLRRLILHGEGNINIAWDRITTFSTDIHAISHLFKLTAVESLVFTFVKDVVETENWHTFQAKMSTLLSLPSVRSLMIQAYGPHPFCHHISQFLHIPSLTTLAINSGESPLPVFPCALPYLRTITLSSSAPPAEINAFFARHSSVTSLCTANLSILRLLHLHPDLLPNLTTLHVDVHVLRFNPGLPVIEVLEDFCESRVQITEYRVWGSGKEMEQWRKGISKITGLLERWDVVCSRLKIVI